MSKNKIIPTLVDESKQPESPRVIFRNQDADQLSNQSPAEISRMPSLLDFCNSENFLRALEKFCRPSGLRIPSFDENRVAPEGSTSRSQPSSLIGEICTFACVANCVVPTSAFMIVSIPMACVTSNLNLVGMAGCWAAIGASALVNTCGACCFTYVVVGRCNEQLMDCVQGFNNRLEARDEVRKILRARAEEGRDIQQQITNSRQQNYGEISNEEKSDELDFSFLDLSPSRSQQVDLAKSFEGKNNKDTFVIVLDEDMTKQAVESGLLGGDKAVSKDRGVYDIDARNLNPNLLEMAGMNISKKILRGVVSAGQMTR